MPEIAEVETVRNVLKKQVLNKQILKVEVYYSKIIESNLEEFSNNLINESFIDILRKGKYLIFETNNYYLISHLRMEGKFFVKDKDDLKGKHEHVKFVFSDNSSLRYEDTRKFGRMYLTTKDSLYNYEGIRKQGYEPLSKELTREYLYELLHSRHKPLKGLLLDQTIISGLGNIYADEVLFFAKLNPNKLGSEIKLNDAQNIINGTNEIIREAIKYGGTTIRSYTSSLGVTGQYQNYLKVHKQNVCSVCGTKIEKIRIAGRSTYFCPKCQK